MNQKCVYVFAISVELIACQKHFKSKGTYYLDDSSINQPFSQCNILETLFSNPNLSRNNQHKNKTLLPYLNAIYQRILFTNYLIIL